MGLKKAARYLHVWEGGGVELKKKEVEKEGTESQMAWCGVVWCELDKKKQEMQIHGRGGGGSGNKTYQGNDRWGGVVCGEKRGRKRKRREDEGRLKTASTIPHGGGRGRVCF